MNIWVDTEFDDRLMPEQNTVEHHALNDALHTRDLYLSLIEGV